MPEAPSHIENFEQKSQVRENENEFHSDPVKEKAVSAINQLLAFEDISTNEKMERVRNKISGSIKKSSLNDFEKEIYKQTLNDILINEHNFVDSKSKFIKVKPETSAKIEKPPEINEKFETHEVLEPPKAETVDKMVDGSENVQNEEVQVVKEIKNKEKVKEKAAPEIPKKVEFIPFNELTEQIVREHPLVKEEEIDNSLRGAIQAYYNHYKGTRSKLGVTFTEASGFPNGDGYSCIIKAQYDNGDLKLIRASVNFKKAKVGKDLNNLKEVEMCKWLILEERLYV